MVEKNGEKFNKIIGFYLIIISLLPLIMSKLAFVPFVFIGLFPLPLSSILVNIIPGFYMIRKRILISKTIRYTYIVAMGIHLIAIALTILPCMIYPTDGQCMLFGILLLLIVYLTWVLGSLFTISFMIKNYRKTKNKSELNFAILSIVGLVVGILSAFQYLVNYLN